MERVGFIFVLSIFVVFASNKIEKNQKLEKFCLHCHKIQQIPDTLIYNRYLMQYSTDARMKKAIMQYLKKPQKSKSIMPKAFFSKFPLKKASTLNDEALDQYVSTYLQKYNLKNKLILESDSY